MSCRLEVRPYALPLAAPVRTSRASRAVRRGWLVRLVAEDGEAGRGEAACWPGFGAGARDTRAALRRLERDPRPAARAVAAALRGDRLDEPGVVRALAGVDAPEARHALEVAVLDLAARRRGVSLAALLAAAPRPSVAVHALVADADAARRAVAAGHRAVKLKVGRGPAALELARVAAVRDAIGPATGLRLDANGAWSAAEALERLRGLAPLRPEWLEQPTPPGDVAGLARVRAAGGVPVAVDEGVVDLASLEAVLAAGAADVLVVKPMALGGLLGARRLAARARAAGLRVCVTHALDAAVGRAAALALAAGLDGDEAHGLGPALARDVAALPAVARGRVALPAGPGLGVVPAELALQPALRRGLAAACPGGWGDDAGGEGGAA